MHQSLQINASGSLASAKTCIDEIHELSDDKT